MAYEDGYFNTCLRVGFFNSKLPARLVYKSYQEIFGDLADLVRNFQDLQKKSITRPRYGTMGWGVGLIAIF